MTDDSNIISLPFFEVIEKFPCLYRSFVKLAMGDCYCTYYDRWVRLKYCRICGKRKVGVEG